MGTERPYPHITDTGNLRSVNPTYTLYPINIAVQPHQIAFPMTYRFPAVLCFRVSFRLSVRQAVFRAILRNSTSYCFTYCPIWAHVVNVALVNVGADKALILALCPTHRRFIADFVGLVRRDFPMRERLPDLKEQGSALHGPACFRLILASRQQKFSGSCGRIAEVRGQGPSFSGVSP